MSPFSEERCGIGVDIAGAHGVDSDAFEVVARHRLGEGVDSTLGGAIGRQFRSAMKPS